MKIRLKERKEKMFKMETMETILTKYEKLNTFLKGIDLKEFSKQYLRKDLEVFTKALTSIQLRSLAYELSELTEALKLKEFPELLGVHHYPELRKIDFLSEEEKIALDERLASLQIGTATDARFYFTLDEKHKNLINKIKNFLLEQGILKEEYYALCPYCEEGYISDRLNVEEKGNLERALADKGLENRYSILEEHLRYICDECDRDYDVDTLTKLTFQPVLVLIKERDKSLDNV
jgi:hypothetical protein